MAKEELSDEAKSWVEKAFRHNYPGISQSALFLHFHPSDEYPIDPMQALQLGMCILMEKPMVIIARPGQKIPEALEALSKATVRANPDTDDKEVVSMKIKHAVEKVIGPLDETPDKEQS